MSKPHEEEWSPDEVIVMHNRHDGQKEAREVLGHAAPDMARALLSVLEQVEYIPRAYVIPGAPRGNIEDACRKVRAALAKAGVPL